MSKELQTVMSLYQSGIPIVDAIEEVIECYGSIPEAKLVKEVNNHE